jgi:hypothetical protein
MYDVRVDSIAVSREILQHRHDYSEKLSDASKSLSPSLNSRELSRHQLIISPSRVVSFPQGRRFCFELTEVMTMLDSAVVSPGSPSFSKMKFGTFGDFEESFHREEDDDVRNLKMYA